MAFLLWLLCGAVGTSAAQPPTQQQQQTLRDSIERAIHPDATYTADVFANMAGGRQRGLLHTGNVQLTMRIDSQPLVGWSGGQLFLHTVTSFGGLPSRLVGDAQGLDNIATKPATLTLYEAWLSQVLLQNRASVLIGFYDLNSEFDVSFPGMLFVHSAHGMGSALALSGPGGPSIYPVTSFGARLKVVPTERAYVQVAVLNARPGNLGGPNGARLPHLGDGALIVAEAGAFHELMDPQQSTPGARRRYIRRQTQARYRVKATLGLWGYTASFPDVSSFGLNDRVSVHRGDYGVYALVDALLVQAEAQRRNGLWAFARAGTARPSINPYPYFFGAGLVYRGPMFTSDENDELGLAVAVARASEPYRRARIERGLPTTRYEVACELTYLAPVLPWLTLQLDLQYIVNPSARPDIANALALLARYQIAF